MERRMKERRGGGREVKGRRDRMYLQIFLPSLQL